MKRMDETIRQKVFKRDKFTCRYCGNKEGPFHADHVYPYVKGGETSLQNLVTACQHCNSKKGSRVGMWPKPIGYFNRKPKAKADVMPYRLILLGTISVISVLVEFVIQYHVPIIATMFIVAPIVCIWAMLVFVWPE